METINSGNADQPLPTGSVQAMGEMQVNNDGINKEKKRRRHQSALLAAAAGRSAVQHAHLHIITNKPGDFAHSATNITYYGS